MPASRVSGAEEASDDAFSALWRDGGPDEAGSEDLLPPTPDRGGRLLAVVATGLGAIGAATIAIALLLPSGAGPEVASAPGSTAGGSAVPDSAGDVADGQAGVGEPDEESDSAVASTRPAISTLADPRWVQRLSQASGIPERALAAYSGAAIRVADAYPGCGLGWNTLAAIGEVESGHGSHGGAVLGSDGRVSPSIIGAALDGTDTARIPDTDGGALDGDATWDRAVGPMQFIPSTWAHYGQDGDGDGTADPDQIDDAALAAAHYLCDVGGDLADPSNWIRAVGDYNPSVEYNNLVAAAADRYAGLG